MSTTIYSHYHKELDYDIAHIDDNGIIYSHPVHEAGYSCGHVGDNGRIYSHPKSKAGFCVGRIDEDGKIYDHPTSKVGHCIGHVDSNGVVYSHSNSELGYEIGHAVGSRAAEGAAVYLLLFSKEKAEPSKPVDEPYAYNSPPVNEKKVRVEPPRPRSSGGGTGFIAFFVIALILGFVQGFLDAVKSFPGMILLIAEMVFAGIFFDKQPKPDEYNVSNSIRAECKSSAIKTALFACILPIALGAYSVFGAHTNNSPSDYIFILLPIFSTYIIVYRAAYQSGLKKCENAPEKPKSYPVSHKETKKPSSKQSVLQEHEKKPQVKKAASKTTAPKKDTVKKEAEKKASVADKVTYVCPGCNASLRLPAGKGKIKIKCPKCGAEITTTT